MLPIRVTSRSTARKGEESITHQKMIKIFQGKSHMLQETGSKWKEDNPSKTYWHGQLGFLRTQAYFNSNDSKRLENPYIHATVLIPLLK